MALLVAWRHARRAKDRIPVRRSVVGRVFEVVSLTPSLGVGLNAALVPRRGRDSIPVRSTLVAVSLAVLGVVSVSMFGPSLDRLSNTPVLFGVGWDVAVDDTLAERPDPDRPCSGLLGTRLEDEPGLEAVGGICNLIVEVEGHPISAFGYMSMRGSIAVTLLDGRAPRCGGRDRARAATRSAL